MNEDGKLKANIALLFLRRLMLGLNVPSKQSAILNDRYVDYVMNTLTSIYLTTDAIFNLNTFTLKPGLLRKRIFKLI